MQKYSMQQGLLSLGLAISLCACSISSQVTRVQDVSQSADTPYRTVLVIALFASFDSRKYLEDEVAHQLSGRGVTAVTATSMMDSTHPVNRQTVLSMVTNSSADAVLVTQPVSLDAEADVKDMRPKSTHIFRPTYYYNVWNHELTEFVEPQSVDFKHELILATQLFEVSTEEQVWAIETDSTIRRDTDHLQDYSIYLNEAETIVSAMAQDRLIAR